MRTFDTVDEYLRSIGAPVPIETPDKWLRGPFFLRVTIPAAATEVNLLAASVLNTDPQIASVWGTSTVPQARMAIWGFQLLSADEVFRIAPPVDKHTIFDQARLSVRVGTSTNLFALGPTTREAFGQQQSATLELAPLEGTPYRLPNAGLDFDTENDGFTIPAFAPALAGSYDFILKVYGAMWPRGAKRDPRLGGGNCGLNTGYSPDDAAPLLAVRPTVLAGVFDADMGGYGGKAI